MKKKSWILWICLLCLISVFFVGCGNVVKEKTLTPKQAKSKLEQDYNIPFNAENFISMVKSNEIEKVKLFLQAGIDPNTRCLDSTDKTYYGKTVLMIATMLGEVDIVHILVDDYKADVKVIDNNQYNILWFVIYCNKPELVKYFVDKGVDVNYVEPVYKNDLLSSAIFSGKKEVVKALVENGADIKRPKRPLMPYAIMCDCNEDMLTTLIQLGADINAKYSNGYSALYFALLNKRDFGVIKLLVDNGADVNFKNGSLSCLILAKQSGSSDKQQIIDYLISHGAK